MRAKVKNSLDIDIKIILTIKSDEKPLSAINIYSVRSVNPFSRSGS